MEDHIILILYYSVFPLVSDSVNLYALIAEIILCYCNRGRVAPREERSHTSPFGVKVDGDRLSCDTQLHTTTKKRLRTAALLYRNRMA